MDFITLDYHLGHHFSEFTFLGSPSLPLMKEALIITIWYGQLEDIQHIPVILEK